MMKAVRKARLALVCVSIIVISLMFAGVSYAKIDPNTCVGMWIFDENEGDIAKDSSGKGHDGTIQNAKRVDGKFGAALELDGATSTVEITLNVKAEAVWRAKWRKRARRSLLILQS